MSQGAAGSRALSRQLTVLGDTALGWVGGMVVGGGAYLVHAAIRR